VIDFELQQKKRDRSKSNSVEAPRKKRFNNDDENDE